MSRPDDTMASGSSRCALGYRRGAVAGAQAGGFDRRSVRRATVMTRGDVLAAKPSICRSPR
jgi:hypothetical protein